MAEKILALCGGIGGTKLVLGLYSILPPDTLTIAVNTGDDFEHLGFSISPDIDTVVYTLGGWQTRSFAHRIHISVSIQFFRFPMFGRPLQQQRLLSSPSLPSSAEM